MMAFDANVRDALLLRQRNEVDMRVRWRLPQLVPILIRSASLRRRRHHRCHACFDETLHGRTSTATIGVQLDLHASRLLLNSLEGGRWLHLALVRAWPRE